MSHDWSALLDQATHRMEMTYHPIIGHLHVPNHVVRLPHERGGYFSRTNAQGFRSDIDFTTERRGRPRILVFGDSFTAGQGCDNHERYAECLGRELRADVFNYGVSGTAPDQQLLMYEELAREVEGDLIILGIALHNIERIKMTHRPSRDRVTGRAILMPKPYFTLEGDELELHHVPVPRVRPALMSGEERGYLDEQSDTGLSVAVAAGSVLRILGARARPVKHWLRGLLYRATDVQMYDDYRDAKCEGWKLLAALIRRFKMSCGDVPLLVVPLPTYHYYVDKLEPIYDPLFEALEDVGGGLHVLSLTRTLVEGKSLAERLGYCFEHDGHYSPRGHATIAKIIAREIRHRGLLPSVPSDSTLRAGGGASPTRHVLGLVLGGRAATALLSAGRVVASAPEEPFWRTSMRSDFPSRSANYCLEEGRIHQTALEACVCVVSPSTAQVDRPTAPAGQAGTWLRPSDSGGLKRLGSTNPLWSALNYSGSAYLVSHAMAQCASAYYQSPFEAAAVLSIHESVDGTVASIAVGSGRNLRMISELRGGTGLEAVARRLAKLVGLSGDDPMFELGLLARSPHGEDVGAVEETLLRIGAEGIFMVPDFDEAVARSAFGLARKVSATRRSEVAGAFLTVVRDCVLKMAEHAREVAARDELCIVGAAVHETSVFAAVEAGGEGRPSYRPPCFGSASAAIGAARLGWHRAGDGERRRDEDRPSTVGPAFSGDEIEAFLDTHDFPHRVLDDARVWGVLAELIADGQRVGFFAGPMGASETGGGRAVLLKADPPTGEPLTSSFDGQLRAMRPWVYEESRGVLRNSEDGAYWIPLQLAGEGVALTPFDAYRCMMIGGLDALLLEGYLVYRKEQPPWPDRTPTVEGLVAD